MREYKRTLVDALVVAFPSDSGPQWKHKAKAEEEEEEVANATRAPPAPQKAGLAWPKCGKASSARHNKQQHQQLIWNDLAGGSISQTWWSSMCAHAYM